MQETLKSFFTFREPLATNTETAECVLARGGYTDIASGGTKIAAKFQRIFGIIRGVSEFLFVHF